MDQLIINASQDIIFHENDPCLCCHAFSSYRTYRIYPISSYSYLLSLSFFLGYNDYLCPLFTYLFYSLLSPSIENLLFYPFIRTGDF